MRQLKIRRPLRSEITKNETLPVGAAQNIQQVCLPATGASLKDLSRIGIRESVELMQEAVNHLVRLVSAQDGKCLTIKDAKDRQYDIYASYGEITLGGDFISEKYRPFTIKLADLATNEINMGGLLWLADCLENAKTDKKTTLYRV